MRIAKRPEASLLVEDLEAVVPVARQARSGRDVEPAVAVSWSSKIRGRGRPSRGRTCRSGARRSGRDRRRCQPRQSRCGPGSRTRPRGLRGRPPSVKLRNSKRPSNGARPPRVGRGESAAATAARAVPRHTASIRRILRARKTEPTESRSHSVRGAPWPLRARVVPRGTGRSDFSGFFRISGGGPSATTRPPPSSPPPGPSSMIQSEASRKPRWCSTASTEWPRAMIRRRVATSRSTSFASPGPWWARRRGTALRARTPDGSRGTRRA